MENQSINFSYQFANQYTQPVLKCDQFYYVEIQKNITLFLMLLLIIKYIITFKQVKFEYKDNFVYYLDGLIFIVCCGLTGSFFQL